MARKVMRLVDTFTPVNSQQTRRRMPLGTTLARYWHRFTATFTTTATPGTVFEDSPYAYARVEDCILNGSFPLRTALSARHMFFLNRFQQNTSPRVTAPGTTASTAFSIVAEWSMDFMQEDLLPPLDAAFWLDTRLLSSVELVYTFGAEADLVSNGATGGTLSAQSVTVYAEEIADQGGPLSRMQHLRLVQGSLVVGNNDIQLPALGPVYRGIAVHYVSGNADALRATSDDTIDTDISLIADNIIRHVDAAPYQTVRSENKQIRQVETIPAGWEVMDFAKAGILRDVVFTSRTRQLIGRINVASVPANAFVELIPLNALLVVRSR